MTHHRTTTSHETATTWDFEGALYTDKHGYPEVLRVPYCQHYRHITSGPELCATLRAGQYAWPGGYQLGFITSDGALLCFDCARDNLDSVIWSIRHSVDDGWRITHCDIISDYESDEYCAHCNRQLAWEEPQ